MIKKSAPKMAEAIFDIAYLLAALTLGMILTQIGETFLNRLWGIMALVLVLGDSFHLLPRVVIAFKGESAALLKAAAFGKMITSLTMTVFYLLLWHCGVMLFAVDLTAFTVMIYVFAAFRIGLSILPQNGWTGKQPSYVFALIRNIPFVLQGLLVTALFMTFSKMAAVAVYVWIAVILSFLFYLPVVLFSRKNAKLGMLMLPKSLCYIFIIALGFFV